MFRHIGKSRTLSHNLKIASLLSFVAGLVNVTGFLAVQRLTTNVTGHFAFFVDEVFKLNWVGALVFLSLISCFLLGAFVSNIMAEWMLPKNKRYVFVLPVILESLILGGVGCINATAVASHANLISCSLLFAMGLQNALVTKISNAVVRTTHLTGLFTDLGIEIAQLFFYTLPEQKKKLYASIRLRLTIIFFFFAGGIAGGVLFSSMYINALIVGAAILLGGLIYDTLKFKLIAIRRKL